MQLALPVTELNRPAAHGVGTGEAIAHEWPSVQTSQLAAEVRLVALEKKPAGHGRAMGVLRGHCPGEEHKTAWLRQNGQEVWFGS